MKIEEAVAAYNHEHSDVLFKRGIDIGEWFWRVATAAERERWIAECRSREQRYEIQEKHDRVSYTTQRLTVRILREAMEADDE